jgi:putative phosphoesterase
VIECPPLKLKDETRYSVSTRIVVVSDTHCHLWTEVHPDIRKAVAEADIAVHCGDFTRMDVAEGFRRSARKAILVHGNSDPPDVRRIFPYVEVIEVESRRIGVTHPAWGGPEFELEELLPDFPEPVDAIIFGHIHETINKTRDGILFLNPGQGYASFMVPATIALLTVDKDKVSSEIVIVQPAT